MEGNEAKMMEWIDDHFVKNEIEDFSFSEIYHHSLLRQYNIVKHRWYEGI